MPKKQNDHNKLQNYIQDSVCMFMFSQNRKLIDFYFILPFIVLNQYIYILCLNLQNKNPRYFCVYI